MIGPVMKPRNPCHVIPTNLRLYAEAKGAGNIHVHVHHNHPIWPATSVVILISPLPRIRFCHPAIVGRCSEAWLYRDNSRCNQQLPFNVAIRLLKAT